MKFCLKTFSFLIFLLFLLFAFSSKTLANSTLFEDNFDGTDGTPLSTHNPLWKGTPGIDYGILFNNRAKSSNGQNSDYYIPSLIGLSNYCVGADFFVPIANSPDFIAISTRGDAIFYEDHYFATVNLDGDVVLAVDRRTLYSDRMSFSTGKHNISLCSVGNSHSLYVDDTLVTTKLDSTYSSGVPGFDLGNNAQIDNFTVTSVDDNTSLNVPLLKQVDPTWGNEIYDSAKKWSPKNPTIGSWGCALTSAAMVFKYNGINKLPNGSDLDPGTLNSWLKSQKDGYVGNGLVNWIALTRLSRLAKNINNLSYDALEYKRKNGYNPTQLINDINSGIPGILQEPGHFIVAKGINGSTFDINDPYYSRDSLIDYGNTFSSLGTYSQSHTDLSYIMLVVNDGINVSMSGGNSSGGQEVQEYINDAQNDGYSTKKVNIYYLPKPQSGNYTVTLTSPSTTNYSLDLYFYDQDGNVFISKKKGQINQGDTVSLPIEFNDSIYSKQIDYVSTILDLQRKNAIKDEKLNLSLMQILIKAKVENILGNRDSEVSYLMDFLDLLAQNQSAIPEPSYSDLIYDANYLSSDH